MKNELHSIIDKLNIDDLIKAKLLAEATELIKRLLSEQRNNCMYEALNAKAPKWNHAILDAKEPKF